MAFNISEIGLRDEVIEGIKRTTAEPLEDRTVPSDPLLELTKTHLVSLLSASPESMGFEVKARNRDGIYHLFVTRRQLSKRLESRTVEPPTR